MKTIKRFALISPVSQGTMGEGLILTLYRIAAQRARGSARPSAPKLLCFVSHCSVHVSVLPPQ